MCIDYNFKFETNNLEPSSFKYMNLTWYYYMWFIGINQDS